MNKVYMPQLGFGVMRLPVENGQINISKTEKLIKEYMAEGGAKYFDTHPSYISGKSQKIIKDFVVKQYPRDSFMIADKMPYYGISDFKDYEHIFEKELEDCGVTYFDYYMLHALTKETYAMHEKLGGFPFLKRKKEEGKVKHIGFSFHDRPELLERILQEHSEVEFVQLQINYLDWDSPTICARKNYETARKYGKQIMVMEPIKGGSLTNPVRINGKELGGSELAHHALSFVANLPGIFIVLSGITEVEHIIQNRKTLSNAKNCEKAENLLYAQLREHIKQSRKIQCTGCRYCIRECPKSIVIPDIISLLNACVSGGYRDNNVMEWHRTFYRGSICKQGKAGDCIRCGRCESKCPQKLPIRSYMNRAARLFEDEAANMNYYTTERNTQILIYLLKAHGIKKIIVSPGTTNINFVYSVQQDGFFEVYSVVDERSAAYMACGLAAETGEPVVLSCTGATASRNYVSALTEAFYRKLPVLAVTSTHFTGMIGHNIPQTIDRSIQQRDIVRLSADISIIHDKDEEWNCETKINEALLELKHYGGGPVHINLTTSGNSDFSARRLPAARVIDRITVNDDLPNLPDGKIGIFVGSHRKWTDELIRLVDIFCESYNAVVLCDQTSNYKGNYGILANLVLNQGESVSRLNDFDVLIHMGEVSGAYIAPRAAEVWRIDLNGKICDTFRKLRHVFEMEEIQFFERYQNSRKKCDDKNFYDEWRQEYCRILKKIPELPFSNIWIAKVTAKKIPDGASLHLGILNSLRSWNFFEVSKEVAVYSNTGGFGIDGCMSSLIGASFAESDKLFFCVLGDLAFFYDINSLGNRHLNSNIRIMLLNNGVGGEFKKYNHIAARFGDEADDYIAAKGHFGKQSATLVKDWAENLGFKYMSASDKEEYLSLLPNFVKPEITRRPILFEIFTDSMEDSKALKLMNTADEQTDLRENKDLKKDSAKEPLRLAQSGLKRKIVLWGTGNCFMNNYLKVEEHCEVTYICDNDRKKWNKEIVHGMICISPEKLVDMKDIFVVIMVENTKTAFQIANQLLDMGISEFDYIYNWLNYADCKWFE